MTERSIRPALLGLGIAAAGLIAALALVYANAAGVEQATEDATIQQASESALGVSANTRFALGQALLFLDAGGVDDQAFAILDRDATVGLTELERRLEALAAVLDSPAPLQESFLVVSQSATEFLAAVRDRDRVAAGVLAATELGAALDRLDDTVVRIRDEAALSLAKARAETSRTGTAARFMVALGAPAIALAVTALGARRRTRRIALETALGKERDLNRSKDQLIANLSHELRTPLTGIYSAALAIEEAEPSDTDLVAELNGMIVDQSADLTRMVEDLLVSAQVDAGRLNILTQPVSMANEVDNVVREFRRTDPLIIKVRDATVTADATRVRQVLRNLVSNAIRHGGPQVSIVGTPKDEGYRLSVIDNGNGVPDDVARRLFERFVHEGDRPLVTGSVGLGLSITRILAREMGGDVDYHRVNGSTEFRLTLPQEPRERTGVRPRSDDEAYVKGVHSP